MKKGCIYYSDNRLDPRMLRICQEQLLKSFKGDIVSVTLWPMVFGRNIVLKDRARSYPTMMRQILMALENSPADNVFFTEHDVLYHPSHFDFIPSKKDTYYYNINNWRWRWGTDIAVTYDGLSSLSGLCCNRELAIKHYKYRIKVMEERGLHKRRGREPRWARRFGYEPGTKPRRRGGITDEPYGKRKSKFPNIDIRHRGTFSHPKTFRREYKHLPPTFREITIDKIEGWDLKKMFDL